MKRKNVSEGEVTKVQSYDLEGDQDPIDIKDPDPGEKCYGSI